MREAICVTPDNIDAVLAGVPRMARLALGFGSRLRRGTLDVTLPDGRLIRLGGLEPDGCYWIEHEAQVRGRLDWDPQRDPPPAFRSNARESGGCRPRKAGKEWFSNERTKKRPRTYLFLPTYFWYLF